MLRYVSRLSRFRRVFFQGRFEKDGAKMFQEHNDLCKALVPEDQLLVFQVTNGWDPLCKFLGVPVPVRLQLLCNSLSSTDHHQSQNEPFPYENEGKAMKQSFDAWEKLLYKEFATYYIAPTVGILALATALGLNRNRLGVVVNTIKRWWESK